MDLALTRDYAASGTTRVGELVDQWRGRHALLTIDLAGTEDDDARQTFDYEGTLDGPYLGDGAGVGFMLGSRIISGDIAVEGPFIHFEPAVAQRYRHGR